jgi:sterol desaturase/sphingolipid hydroxylase (fatty acid hydroxylase superfamily)
MSEDKKLELQIESLKKDVDYIKEMLRDFKKYLMRSQEENEKKFVTQDQFKPIKLIVYGMVSVILLAVLSNILQK